MSGGRPLLAARTSSGDNTPEGAPPGASRPPPNATGNRPKRTLIESACSACRRRKSRCDGVRPTCSRCQNLRTDCQYEAEEGESRWSALRRRNQILEAERDQLRELMAYVQTRAEPEAQDIFQRIRQCNYDDLFLLLRQLKDGAVGIHPPGMPSHPLSMTSPGVEHRLPPIQTILDVPGHAHAHGHGHVMQPPHLVHQQSLSSEDSRTSSGDLGVINPLPHHHRSVLDTLEPSLRQHVQQQMASAPSLSLSSEESTGSMGSTTMDMQRPYRTP